MSEFEPGSGRKRFVRDVMRRITPNGPQDGEGQDDANEHGVVFVKSLQLKASTPRTFKITTRTSNKASNQWEKRRYPDAFRARSAAICLITMVRLH